MVLIKKVTCHVAFSLSDCQRFNNWRISNRDKSEADKLDISDISRVWRQWVPELKRASAQKTEPEPAKAMSEEEEDDLDQVRPAEGAPRSTSRSLCVLLGAFGYALRRPRYSAT